MVRRILVLRFPESSLGGTMLKIIMYMFELFSVNEHILDFTFNGCYFLAIAILQTFISMNVFLM